METKSLLNESLEYPIEPEIESPVITIGTELPKLLKLAIESLSQDKLDRLMDFYVTMDKSKF